MSKSPHEKGFLSTRLKPPRPSLLRMLCEGVKWHPFYWPLALLECSSAHLVKEGWEMLPETSTFCR